MPVGEINRNFRKLCSRNLIVTLVEGWCVLNQFFFGVHALSTDLKTEKLKECMWLYFQLDLTIFQAIARYM